jgi:hypothetical protein
MGKEAVVSYPMAEFQSVWIERRMYEKLQKE